MAQHYRVRISAVAVSLLLWQVAVGQTPDAGPMLIELAIGRRPCRAVFVGVWGLGVDGLERTIRTPCRLLPRLRHLRRATSAGDRPRRS